MERGARPDGTTDDRHWRPDARYAGLCALGFAGLTLLLDWGSGGLTVARADLWATRLVLRDTYGGSVALGPETLVANPLLWHRLDAGAHRLRERGTLRYGVSTLRQLGERIDGGNGPGRAQGLRAGVESSAGHGRPGLVKAVSISPRAAQEKRQDPWPEREPTLC